MGRICKHGVDCFERVCEECADKIFGRLGKKDLPHAENMQGTQHTESKPSLDDYDNKDTSG